MVRRLNEVSAEGLEVLSYRELPETAKNAMSLVAAADYTFWFKVGICTGGRQQCRRIFGKFLTFCKNETIPFVKQTKKGERTVDLRPLICEARIAERKEYVPAMVADWYPDLENETVEEEKQAEGICVFLRLLSGSAANGKPEQVLQAFYESLGLTTARLPFRSSARSCMRTRAPRAHRSMCRLRHMEARLCKCFNVR